jgi:hypothetical protein
MRRTVMRLLAVATLLALLGPATPVPTAAAPAALEETGVYEEDFTAYTFKDYVDNANWDVWARGLRLARPDAVLQYCPSIATDGSGNTIVVWQDYRNGDGDIYAQRLDASGNRLWAADVRVNLGSGMASQEFPALAMDGSGNVVVAWRDDRNGNGDIYAQKLGVSGNRLWTTDVRVNSDSGTADQWFPAVAVDDSGSAVVVWHDYRNGNGDVYAQKLDGSGNRLWPSDVRVNSDSGMAWQRNPAVAVDGSGNAVIVWRDEHNGNDDICAQKLDGGGNNLWAADLRVNSDSGTADQWSPAVAVDGSGNAIVVWTDERNGDYDRDIYTQKLDESGNRLWAADVCVNSDSGTTDQTSPIVATGGGGNAVVVWEDQRNDNGDIYAQELDGSGSKLWAVDVRVNSDSGMAQQYSPAMAVDDDGSAVVMWQDHRSGEYDIYAQRLDASGNWLWTVDVRVNSDSGATSQCSSAVAVGGSGNSVIVWEDRRSGNEDIYIQRLDGSGNKLWAADVRVNPISGTMYRGNPTVAVDGSGNAIVVWSDRRNDSGDIYAQRFDGNGNRLCTAEVRVNSDRRIASQWSPAVAVDGSGSAVVVWHDCRNVNGDVYAQKLDESGNRLWPSDVRVNSDSGTAQQLAPTVAVDGSGNAVVVWRDERNGGYENADIYAQKLDGSGNRLWASDVRVNSDSGIAVQNSSAVAMDGSGDVVVVWTDDRNGSDDIYAQKLGGIGSKLWPVDVHVSSDGEGENRYAGDVAVDGSGNISVVWQDYRNDDCDIYAQKLDRSGNRLWIVDVRVNSDSGTADQARPAVRVHRDGSAISVWHDYRNGNGDIYAQRINIVGGKVWLADLQVVYPDRFYLPTGTAQSRTVDTVTGNICEANLTADYQTNGGAVQFYLTNDGGGHWAEVTPGVTHVFTTTGSDLRWRAVLDVDPIWNRTPVVNSLRIEYSTQAPYADDYESDDTCAQARPIQVNGAAQQHTFHQHEDADWVWFQARAGVTYVVQTANTGPRADTLLELYAQCGQPPSQSDDNPFGPGASLIFQAPSSGTYYVRVLQSDGSVYGEGSDYELSVRAQAPPGAAVIVAGRMRADDYRQPIINATANLAYQTFLESGFSAENIQYLNADLSQPGVDGVPSWGNVRDAIQDWARGRVGLGVPLWVYLADHGKVDWFHNDVDEVITAAELNLWLSNLEATSGVDQINVIIDACHSGSFIDTQQMGGYGLEEISGHGRVVVTSTTYRWFAYAPRIVPGQPVPLMYFSDGFWRALGDSQDVWNAFLAGRASVEAGGQLCGDYDYTCQRPWLDDDGDAWFDSADGQVARGRGLAAAFGGGVAPYIDWVEVSEVSGGRATVRAQVRDDGSVARVWGRVFAPSFAPPESGDGSIPLIEVPEVEMGSAGGDVYQAEYAGFTERGVYQVVVYAVDDGGSGAMPRWVLVGGQRVYLPLVMRSN